MKRQLLNGLVLACLGMPSTVRTYASEFDPFRVNAGVSVTASKTMLTKAGEVSDCHAITIPERLDLGTAVELALCNHPQTRQAWAGVKLQAAQVGTAWSAYLPGIQLAGERSKGYYDSETRNIPELAYSIHSMAHDVSLNMNWTIFDFGTRAANLENARQLLLAANSTQDAMLQAVFANAAQAFYDLQSAIATLDANREAEKSAKESLDVADGKYHAGVGSLADKLQAQTNHEQAQLHRIQSEGDVRGKHGILAAAMGLPVETAFELESMSVALPDISFVESVDKLIAKAKVQHPNILAAQAQVKAAEATIDSAKADGLPTLSLVGVADREMQPGQYAFDTTNRTNKIGVQLKIPLFEGMGRSYRVAAAKAQMESKQADLANTEQQVALNVWKSYQTLMAESENLKFADDLMQSADSSYSVARGRYKAGVGTIIELLNAQTTLADARRQKIQLLAEWNATRIELAASLGQLGMWATR
jgi:outer membrane protein